MRSVVRVFSYLRHYPGLAAAQLGCAVGMTMAIFVFPNATRHVINEIVPDPARHGEFGWWIAVALAGFLVKDGLNAARILINNTFEQKVIFDIRSELYAKIQRLPLRWQARGGKLISCPAEICETRFSNTCVPTPPSR